MNEESKEAVAPPGWEGPVKEMKKDKGIDNPWALAWWQKGQSHKPHKKEADALLEFKDALIVKNVVARYKAT